MSLLISGIVVCPGHGRSCSGHAPQEHVTYPPHPAHAHVMALLLRVIVSVMCHAMNTSCACSVKWDTPPNKTSYEQVEKWKWSEYATCHVHSMCMYCALFKFKDILTTDGAGKYLIITSNLYKVLCHVFIPNQNPNNLVYFWLNQCQN